MANQAEIEAEVEAIFAAELTPAVGELSVRTYATLALEGSRALTWPPGHHCGRPANVRLPEVAHVGHQGGHLRRKCPPPRSCMGQPNGDPGEGYPPWAAEEVALKEFVYLPPEPEAGLEDCLPGPPGGRHRCPVASIPTSPTGGTPMWRSP
jgi:hypothetical protein